MDEPPPTDRPTFWAVTCGAPTLGAAPAQTDNTRDGHTHGEGVNRGMRLPASAIAVPRGENCVTV